MRLQFTYDHYYDYDEITDHLSKQAEQYPELMELSSAGVTVEGKQIWAVTLSDKSGLPASAKPAFYMDGNTHAGEVSGSMACMHMID